MSKTTLMICSPEKDYRYLRYCLRSVAKFATGFHELRLQIPSHDHVAFEEFCRVEQKEHERLKLPPMRFPMQVDFYDEWPNMGMVHHELRVCEADLHCPWADIIAHMDPDCVFTEPVTPDSWMTDGKPNLIFEPFDSINRRHPGVGAWRAAAEDALGFPCLYETMRCLPLLYCVATYRATRRRIEERHRKSFEEFMKGQRNAFPQSFCEYVTLGNVALKDHAELYQCGDQSQSRNPDFVNNHLFQAWSHAPPEESKELWWKGMPMVIRPLDIYAGLGLV